MNRLYEGLSCYTANLARYLSAECDAEARLGGSVRLAVRRDLRGGLLAFSHHDVHLDELPDGNRLRYASSPSAAAALAGLAAEIDAHGRVLAVADNARLPWSPSRGTKSAPHWLLIDSRAGDSWHVVDEFGGQLPAGEQRPFTGWLATATLCEALTAPSRWTLAQEQRDRLVFGFPVPVPKAGSVRWLRREQAGPSTVQLPGQWLTGDAQVLPFLASYFAEHGTRAEVHLEDVWAAAGHRIYAYRWRLGRPGITAADTARLRHALSRWERLPGILRFAVESARRGSPRPSLSHRAMSELLQASTEESP